MSESIGVQLTPQGGAYVRWLQSIADPTKVGRGAIFAAGYQAGSLHSLTPEDLTLVLSAVEESIGAYLWKGCLPEEYAHMTALKNKLRAAVGR